MIKPAPLLWRPELKRGMSGADVAAWQEVNRLSHEPPTGWTSAWPIKVDGQFGPVTQALTSAFRRDRGLPSGVVVDALVRSALDQSLFASPATVPVDGLPTITFIQAKYWQWADRKTVDWIVLHSAEVIERPSSAEAVGAYFKGPLKQVSSHFTADNDSIIQSVRTQHIAWHAGPANARSIGIEQAGYARQSRQEWLDAYSFSMLKLVATLVAREARAWNIPLVKLAPKDLVAGARGLCGHADVNAAFPGNGGHWDPGPTYPWDVLLDLAKAA